MQVSSPSVRPLALDLCTSRQSSVSLAEDTPSKQVSEGSGQAPAMITISVLCDISHLKGTSQYSRNTPGIRVRFWLPQGDGLAWPEALQGLSRLQQSVSSGPLLLDLNCSHHCGAGGTMPGSTGDLVWEQFV